MTLSRMQPEECQDYMWLLLPGETTQACFDGAALDIISAVDNNNFSETWADTTYISTCDDDHSITSAASISGAWSTPTSASTSTSTSTRSKAEILAPYARGLGRSAKTTKDQIVNGPLASLFSVAGSHFHNRYSHTFQDNNHPSKPMTKTIQSQQLPSTPPFQRSHQDKSRSSNNDNDNDNNNATTCSLPHSHSHHYNRNHTHPYSELSSTSKSVSKRQSSLTSMTRVVITNFRICSLQLQSQYRLQQKQQKQDAKHNRHQYIVQHQIALSTIATITPQDHNSKIVLTLKFDSAQYIISHHPDTHDDRAPFSINSPNSSNSSLIAELASTLRRLAFIEEVQLRFPFQMGRSMTAELEKGLEKELEKSQGYNQSPLQSENRVYGEGPDTTVAKKARLWTAEDIIALPFSSRSQKRKCLKGTRSKDHIDMEEKLGWEGGFDLASEYRRLKFDESLWAIAHLNGDFELSPTYPQQFIMPRSFLDYGDESKVGGYQQRYSSTSRGSGLQHTTTDSSTAHSRQQSLNQKIIITKSPTACIKQLCAFRSNKRFPIVCWRSPDTGLVLMRSSQPMVGFLGARGPEDELYVRMVLNTAAREQCRTKASPKPTPKLCIMDARAYASAVANGYVGGGRENPEHYPNATISYMSLGNIHVIASAHQALLKAVSTPLDSMNWYTQIESTGWLNHVADLLKAASGRDGIVGRMLEGGSSVLVHCTDGWDRTTQLVSLAQILLDPYYRTINGLRVLIEKEWLSCGHPFQSRTDAVPSTKKPIPEDEPWWQPTTITTTTPGIIHSSPNGAKESISSSWMHPPSSSSPPPISTPSHALWSDMYHPKQASAHAQNLTIPLAPSPVFLLFMTCLHHIVQQHPNRFEYNDYLLVILARAAGGASPFGDFMYNNERERAQDRLRQRTPSIWGWINENRGWFTNNDYYDYTRQSQRERAEGQTIYGHEQSWRDQVLKIQTGGRFTSLWSEYYLNLTPTWFPDPRTVLMNSAFNKECRSKLLSQPLSMWSIYREIVLLRDPWYSSQFDSAQLQQLTFPGLSSIPSQLPQRLQSYQHHQQHLHHQGLQHHQKQKEQQSTAVIMTTMETIPPALALLRGQEMHQYYLLVQHLKKRRKNMVREAFLGWRRWTKLRLEQRVARESGWVVDGVSTYSSSQEEGAFDEDSEAHNGQGGDEEENYGNSGSEMGDQSLINIYKDGSGITGSDKLRQHYSQAQSQRQRRRRTWGQERELSPPRLKVVTAKEGIEVAIGKALEGGAFFGTTGPLIYDPEASSNDGGDADKDGDNVYTEKSSCAGTCRDNNDDAATIDDGFDDMLETFDDLGIPVTPSKAYITTRA